MTDDKTTDYGEPWEAEMQAVWNRNGQQICCADSFTNEEKARIAACVSALAGRNPEAVGEALAAFESLVEEVRVLIDNRLAPARGDGSYLRAKTALAALKGEPK